MLIRTSNSIRGTAIGALAIAGLLAGTQAANAGSETVRHGLLKRSSQAASRASGVGNLTYKGGRVSSKGIKVYIVYWGTQWGGGTTTPASDPTGAAAVQKAFLQHLGGTGDTWSSSTTQYCDGVATGTVNCGSSGAHVVRPAQNVVAGTWVDSGSSPVNNASDASITAEAVRAAAHFNDYSDGVQYVIDFPKGVMPNGFAGLAGGNYCAWHDSTVTAGHTIAYTNMPYMTDAGASCGANFVTPTNGVNGNTEGVTIVGGHEYAETVTDQWPSTKIAWTDTTGYENGDKCAWLSSGTGASKVVNINGGYYAVQSLWSNVNNGCVTAY